VPTCTNHATWVVYYTDLHVHAGCRK